MRIIGYTLLILGFAVILLIQSSFLKTAIRTYSKSRDALPNREAFTRSEVEGALLETAKSAAYHSRGSIVGPIAMLAGGILLDVARRRKKGQMPAA